MIVESTAGMDYEIKKLETITVEALLHDIVLELDFLLTDYQKDIIRSKILMELDNFIVRNGLEKCSDKAYLFDRMVNNRKVYEVGMKLAKTMKSNKV